MLEFSRKPSSEIQRAEEAVARAKDDRAEVVRNEQESCPHRIVEEQPWHAYKVLGGSSPAKRRCCNCLLEETGSHWSGGKSWHRHDYKDGDLGNIAGRVIVILESGQYWGGRVRHSLIVEDGAD